MKKMMIGAALMLAGMGVAGTASAGCGGAGFFNVCLFEEYGYSGSYGYCDYGWGYCYGDTYGYGGNTAASAVASGPGGSAGASASQNYYNDDYYFYYLDGSYSYTSESNQDGTNVNAFAGPFGAGFNQYAYDSSFADNYGNGGSSEAQDSYLYAYSPAGGYAVDQYGYSYNYGWGAFSACQTNYNLPAAGSGTQPCVISTAAGPVDTTIPQLYRTCVSPGTPVPDVCGRFPVLTQI